MHEVTTFCWRNQCQERIALYREKAIAKVQQSEHWGDIGLLQIRTLDSLRSVLEELDTTSPVDQFKEAFQRKVESILSELRQGSADEDGFALVAVHSILREMETIPTKNVSSLSSFLTQLRRKMRSIATRRI